MSNFIKVGNFRIDADMVAKYSTTNTESISIELTNGRFIDWYTEGEQIAEKLDEILLLQTTSPITKA